MKKIKYIILGALVPLISSAQVAPPLTWTGGLITRVGELAKSAIVVVGGLALLAFLFGLMKTIFKLGGDEKAIEEGKSIMKWGLIALFIMISVLGIINLIQHEFGLPQTQTIQALPIGTPSPSPSFGQNG